MTGDTVQIPGTHEWVWTFFPWGLLFTVVAVGSLATGQFTLAAVMLAADIGYSAFMLHIRRLNRQTFLRVSGDRLCVVSRDGT